AIIVAGIVSALVSAVATAASSLAASADCGTAGGVPQRARPKTPSCPGEVWGIQTREPLDCPDYAGQ
ncbi:MAG: hypothetical protein KDK70_38415, partial [Myxococcales bacterium]|nr:hypothetical protein [Myxococcales bacterium]